MLHYAAKYPGMEEGLLAQTNAGGENVARGATLGALYGAAGGMASIPAHLMAGLADSESIGAEIEAFVAAAAIAKAANTKSDL